MSAAPYHPLISPYPPLPISFEDEEENVPMGNVAGDNIR